MHVRVARYPFAWLRVLDALHPFSLFSVPAVTSRSCLLDTRMNEILDAITSKKKKWRRMEEMRKKKKKIGVKEA